MPLLYSRNSEAFRVTMSIANDIATAATMGALTGAGRYAWSQGPVTSAPSLSMSKQLQGFGRGVVRGASQFAIMGGMYTIASAGCAGLRNKEDSFNSGAGGAAVGIFLGLSGKTGGLHSAVHKGLGVAALGILCSFVTTKMKERSLKNAERVGR